MKNYYFKILLLVFVFITVLNCAKRSRPTGGPKDENSPIMISAKPSFETTNFKTKEIKISFDEYIKLKDINTQLVVSPPLKYPPIITPVGTPSKYIKIKILDTLKENTTYTFNFGQSVVDNTEGNILNNFKYVFSTGDVIDSLKVSGIIKDAFNEEADKNISVMLYELNEQFNDSLIYKEKPTYVANSLDTVAWEITNIKAGKYKLVALNDASKNYKFNPKEDKIGFLAKEIEIPTEESFEISLFKEILPYKLLRPNEVSKGHVVFGYEGVADSISINEVSKNIDFKYVTTFEKDKDSLNLWYKNVQADSLQFEVTNLQFTDTVTVKLRSKKIDSLQINTNSRGTLLLRNKFQLLSNIPLESIDTTKISFVDKDTLKVAYKTAIPKSKDKIIFDFNKKHNERYRIQILPDAIKDFYGNVNDTLNYSFATKQPSDYGNVYLTLQNVARYPVIVELIKGKNEITEIIYAEVPQEFVFKNLYPAKYKIRLIYDDNKNRKWDAGNFLLKLQPEKVVYFPSELDVRANWEITETFVLN